MLAIICGEQRLMLLLYTTFTGILTFTCIVEILLAIWTKTYQCVRLCPVVYRLHLLLVLSALYYYRFFHYISSCLNIVQMTPIRYEPVLVNGLRQELRLASIHLVICF